MPREIRRLEEKEILRLGVRCLKGPPEGKKSGWGRYKNIIATENLT